MKAKKKAKTSKRAEKARTSARRQRSVSNKTSFAAEKIKMASYVPKGMKDRYTELVVELAKRGQLETPEDIQNAVLSLVMGGMTLRLARVTVGCTHYQWHSWLHESADLKKRYDLAKEERTESWADDIMEDAESANAFNAPAVKLRIETKRWLMGKHSGRYADKTTTVHEGNPDAPIRHIHEAASAREAQDIYTEAKKHRALTHNAG